MCIAYCKISPFRPVPVRNGGGTAGAGREQCGNCGYLQRRRLSRGPAAGRTHPGARRPAIVLDGRKDERLLSQGGCLAGRKGRQLGS